MDDQLELIELQHTPIIAPRSYPPGEAIYLNLWQEFAQARPAEWEQIFVDLGHTVDQRTASVAASFMVWMGCNDGVAFTTEAEWEVQYGGSKSRDLAFLSTWARHNRRRHAVNHGLRTSEFMLAPVHPIEDGRLVWERVPEISQRDNDVLECMVCWWSSSQAATFRKIAKPMIQAAEEKYRSGLFQPDAEVPA